MMAMIKKFRSETPSREEIQRDQFKSGFAPLFAALFFQAIPFLDEKVIFTPAWRVFLFFGFAAPAVLHFLAAYRIGNKSRHDVILAQSATVVLHIAFAVIMVAFLVAPNSPLHFLIDQLGGFPDSLIQMVFLAILLISAMFKGAVCLFYVRYIGRLDDSSDDKAGYGDFSGSRENSSFFVRNLRNMIIRSKEPGEERHRRDMLPLTRNSYGFIAPVAAIACIGVAGWLISLVAAENLVDLFMPPLMVVIALLFIFAPKYYVKRKSVFETGRSPIQTLDEFSARIILYRDGIEFREYFTAYFLPYNKILKVSGKKSFFESEIRIESDLPGVPDELHLNTDKAAGFVEEIKRRVENAYTDTEEQGSDFGTEESGDRSSAPPFVENPVQKPVVEDIKTETPAPKKLIAVIVIFQVLSIFLATPAWVVIKRITHDPSQERVRVYSPDEYRSKTNSPPEATMLVEVQYSEEGGVIRETYYTAIGNRVQMSYQGGRSKSTTSFFLILTAVYVFLAMGLIAAGVNFYKPLRYAGVAMFGTACVSAILHYLLMLLVSVE